LCRRTSSVLEHRFWGVKFLLDEELVADRQADGRRRGRFRGLARSPGTQGKRAGATIRFSRASGGGQSSKWEVGARDRTAGPPRCDRRGRRAARRPRRSRGPAEAARIASGLRGRSASERKERGRGPRGPHRRGRGGLRCRGRAGGQGRGGSKWGRPDERAGGGSTKASAPVASAWRRGGIHHQHPRPRCPGPGGGGGAPRPRARARAGSPGRPANDGGASSP